VIVDVVPTVGVGPSIVTAVVVEKMPLTTADAADSMTLSLYPDYVEVSMTRRVEPTSPESGVYMLVVAPLIGAQLAPVLSHFSHTYV